MVPKMSDEERRLKVRMGIADLLRPPAFVDIAREQQ